MTPLFKKLNLRDGSTEIVLLNAPESFRSSVAELEESIHVSEVIATDKPFHFMLAFVTQQQQVNELSKGVAKEAADDAVIWFCYPKGNSKKYKCDFNRDTGWTVLGDLGFEPVQMVAIDSDWSALRFRKVQHIKKMTRSTALSKEGKIKAGISPAE